MKPSWIIGSLLILGGVFGLVFRESRYLDVYFVVLATGILLLAARKQLPRRELVGFTALCVGGVSAILIICWYKFGL
jgi:hypothetical protein